MTTARLLALLLLVFHTIAGAELPPATETDEWRAVFEQHQTTGTFVLLDVQADEMWVHNLARARKGFLPASTFKIPNSLIALQLGAVEDVAEVLPWDGTTRSRKSLNRDHDMRSAIRYSVVWFYQEMARRIGFDRMTLWLAQLNYGNQDVSAGIDQFWLSGEFRISALEQTEFLRELAAHRLPFEAGIMDQVHDILLVDQGPGYRMFAKTGWAVAPDPDIGWYVGWVDSQAGRHVFVANLDIAHAGQAPARTAIVRQILTNRSIINPEGKP
jgi:beta-lactamase class D